MKKFIKYARIWLLLLCLFGITACGSKPANVPSQTVPSPQTAASSQTYDSSTNKTSGDSANQTTEAETKQQQTKAQQTEVPSTESARIDENGSYTSKDDVALYINQYDRLPNNFITKKAAQALGWSGGLLESYAPGKSIGGDRFGNYEGKLPKKNGRTYTECDIDTLGKSSRGAKRIVFSNDGLIYYTDDHYETFTLLYGKP